MLAKAMFHENRPTIHTDFLFKGIAKVSNTPILLLLDSRRSCFTKFIAKAAFALDIINYKLLNGTGTQYYTWFYQHVVHNQMQF